MTKICKEWNRLVKYYYAKLVKYSLSKQVRSFTTVYDCLPSYYRAYNPVIFHPVLMNIIIHTIVYPWLIILGNLIVGIKFYFVAVDRKNLLGHFYIITRFI